MSLVALSGMVSSECEKETSEALASLAADNSGNQAEIATLLVGQLKQATTTTTTSATAQASAAMSSDSFAKAARAMQEEAARKSQKREGEPDGGDWGILPSMQRVRAWFGWGTDPLG